MVKNNPTKQDGRGRSAGSRKTQFSQTNQPDRSKRKRRNRKGKRPDNAVDPVRDAIFDEVRVMKNGKPAKVPFIEALMQSMKKNVFNAPLSDQLKLLNLITRAGVFDVEEYRERIFRNINGHFKQALAAGIKAADFADELGEEYRRVGQLYHIYFTAYLLSASECTCGACERGLDNTAAFLQQAMQAMEDADDVDDEDHTLNDDLSELDDDELSEAKSEEPGSSDTSPPPSKAKASLKVQKKPKPGSEDDPDDDFYSGMIGKD